MTKGLESNGGAAFSPARLHAALAGLPESTRYRVALSGGADSVALLHALSRLREQLPAVTIAAVHVHHGLQPQADAWQAHCQSVCAEIDVALDVLRVDARGGDGESPEAAARRARYHALTAVVREGETILTGHHQRDQAETILLQLLRGAGPRGLAAMPRVARLGSGWLARPLLDESPRALREYLLEQGIEWVEDESNRDLRFDRNFIRHEILPRLEGRWPSAVPILARAARHQADAAASIDILARMDLESSRGRQPDTLSCTALEALASRRARSVLRAWLDHRGLPSPPESRIDSILHQVLPARADATPLVAWPGAEVRRFRDELYAGAPLAPHETGQVLDWNPEEPLLLPHGRLSATRCVGEGLSAERCADGLIQVRFRGGGERCRVSGSAHATALKKLLQEHAVPPWHRDRIPLIYLDGELAAVAGLWVCEGYEAPPRVAGWRLSWEEIPRAPGHGE